MSRLKKVLVVGGGTAGWLAACYLAKAVNAVDPQGVQVHLVESSNIGLLGVGEATFPSIRGTLSAIGLALRKEVLFRRGAIKSPRQRAPGSSLTAHDKAELENLIKRLERRLAAAGHGTKVAAE